MPTRGRPKKEESSVVYQLTLSLNPRKHAGIIARLEAAGPRFRSAVAVDMMCNGVGSTPLPSFVSEKEIEIIDHDEVDADF